MLRNARKNELYQPDTDDILRMWRKDYAHPEAVIRWVPGKRNKSGGKMIYKGFYELAMNGGIDDLTGEQDDSPVERAAIIEICTECDSLYARIPGGIEDDLEFCMYCGALIYEI